jgi:hypothetical protein
VLLPSGRDESDGLSPIGVSSRGFIVVGCTLPLPTVAPPIALARRAADSPRSRRAGGGKLKWRNLLKSQRKRPAVGAAGGDHAMTKDIAIVEGLAPKRYEDPR